MTETPVHQLIQRFYGEVWSAGDEKAAYEILAASVQFRGSLGPQRTGPDGFLTYAHAIHAALGNFECIIEDLIEAEPRAAAKMRFTGLHQGALFGVSATNRRITWSGAAFFTSNGHQLTDIWVLGDIEALKIQLGAIIVGPFES